MKSGPSQCSRIQAKSSQFSSGRIIRYCVRSDETAARAPPAWTRLRAEMRWCFRKFTHHRGRAAAFRTLAGVITGGFPIPRLRSDSRLPSTGTSTVTNMPA